jgi:hypothetical protein
METTPHHLSSHGRRRVDHDELACNNTVGLFQLHVNTFHVAGLLQRGPAPAGLLATS